MFRQAQIAAPSHPRPLWFRCLAAFCLLLVFGLGIGQAAHVHGQWLPHSGTHAGSLPSASQTPIGEEHCQLCQAMHSAQPVAGESTLATLPVQRTPYFVEAEKLPEAFWQFVMFSRPPPVAASV